ncbi:TrmB family transcriptional regulator [Salinispira pacifica]|uniref:Transcriptional regulator, TrmB family n=1 Tax=Salinispira pacifica TaxID=1307761 RepID=V5WD88_9SPIO|nr:TrmB family transcriptional regulator [Salinispira pacifica]AHC13555.1 Transcriptional regulator, TrmB family [Salinispira pacifica]
MTQLYEQLEILGLSRTEAQVYLSLLRGGQMTGYQIAKDLGISRSGVYNVLQSLYKQGAVYLIPGESREYTAKSPKEFIGELKDRYTGTADRLSMELESLTGDADSEQFFNIRGTPQVLRKARSIISRTGTEILINTDIPVAEFNPELREACARGVQVTMFSFYPQDPGDLPIRFFNAARNPEPGHSYCDGSSRLMLTSDMERCLLGGRSQGDFTATFSQNPLLTSVIAEHIHLDIYLLGLRRSYGLDNIPEKLLVNSIMESQSENTNQNIRSQPNEH